MPKSVRVTRSHPATARVWKWLKHGDGMQRPPEQHQRIQEILIDLDILLNELDRETASQERDPATRPSE